MGTKVLVLFETISLFRDLSVSLQSNNEYITEPNDDNGYSCLLYTSDAADEL